MPGGIVQPGGAGTTIFVYDTAFSANGLGYKFSEVQAAFPSDFEKLTGDVTGLVFNAARPQYLSNVTVQLGGQGSDGTNSTTLEDTNVDVFFRIGGLAYRVGGGQIITKFGTKLGVGSSWTKAATMCGYNGVGLYQNGNIVLRNDYYIYGSILWSGNNFQFLTTGGSAQEVAGCLVRAASGNCVIGDNISSGKYYNNRFLMTGSGTAFNGIRNLDMDGNDLAVLSPFQIVGTSFACKFRKTRFIGTPTTSDARVLGAADWKMQDVIWSDTPGVPRMSFSAADILPSAGPEHYSTFDTKICDPNGISVGDISVYMVSDIDGPIVDTKTIGDGSIQYVHGPTGWANVVLVREEYVTASVRQVRDRTFTLTVNGSLGTYPRNSKYPVITMVFQWAGRDKYASAYLENGGTFQPVTMPVQLDERFPATVEIPAEVDIVERIRVEVPNANPIEVQVPND